MDMRHPTDNLGYHSMTGNQPVWDPPTVEYFNSVAGEYFSLYQRNTPGSLAFRLRRQRVLELFDKPGGKVLDVGCGPGVMAYDLLAQNCAFWGIDPSSRMIDQATRRFGSQDGANFSIGAAEQIEFPNNFFDAVICMGVIERAKNEGKALGEMIRVLKRDGTFIITLPNKFSPYLLWRDFVFYSVVSLLRPLYYRLSGKTRPPVISAHKLYSATSYSDLLAQHECHVRAVVYCGFNLILSPLDSFFPHLTVWTMEKLEILRHIRFRRLAGCFVIKAQKQ